MTHLDFFNKLDVHIYIYISINVNIILYDFTLYCFILTIILYYMATYGAKSKEARTETQIVNMFRSVSAQGPANARGWSINSMPDQGPPWFQPPSHGPRATDGFLSHFNQGFHLLRWDVSKLTCLNMPIFVIFLLSWTVFLCQQRCWYSCWYWKKRPAMKTCGKGFPS